MAWEVEGTNEFADWYGDLDEIDQAAVTKSVELLENLGPYLGRPHVDTVKASQYSNMKELRMQSKGRPLRSFFAFDPNRTAIILIGGDKTGDDRFYEHMIPKADALYTEYLEEIQNAEDP